jgi:hypothetical protein
MSTRCLNFDHQINGVSWIYANSNSFLLMHKFIFIANFSQAEKRREERSLKYFVGSPRILPSEPRRLKWKKLQIILVLISEFVFVVSQLNYFMLKVVDLEPFKRYLAEEKKCGQL